MTEEEQSERHGRIGMTLVSATGILSRNRLNSDDLVVIGQINLGRSQEHSAELRANFAGKSRLFWVSHRFPALSHARSSAEPESIKDKHRPVRLLVRAGVRSGRSTILGAR